MVGSWKLWAVVVFLAALAGGVSYGILRYQARADHEQVKRDTDRILAEASRNFSRQVSNQIAAQFEQPAIRATVDQVMAEKSAELFTNTIWPSLQAFRDSLTQAHVHSTAPPTTCPFFPTT